MIDNTAVDKARIVYYGLFASAFAFDFGKQEFTLLSNAINTLHHSPIDDLTGATLAEMQQFIEEKGFAGIKDESDQVFYSPATSHLPMTASFYYENRDDGSQRVEMIDYLLQSPFRRNIDTFRENEDHIEFILLFIQHLINDALEGNRKSALLAEKVFTNVLNGMIDSFAANVFQHEKSDFYKNVAVLLYSFVDIERQLFDVGRPIRLETKDMMRQEARKEKLPPRQMPVRNLEEFGSL